MNTARRRRVAVVCAAVLALGSLSSRVNAFWLLGRSWSSRVIEMRLQLGPSGRLSDGAADWDQVAVEALADWNRHTQLAQFSGAKDSSGITGGLDGRNSVFFADAVYGRPFDDRTLATSVSWSIRGTDLLENDVIFNTGFQWDSYRGNDRFAGRTYLPDLRRVALHEFGHVLGLGHPDENGQRVRAIMNSIVGESSLTDDDINAALALYSGSAANVAFPARNESLDFRGQLEGLYRNELNASSNATFVDLEGDIVWTSEYFRYRVGQCSHASATNRVTLAIDGLGSPGVCGAVAQGAVAFPPRDESLLFRNQLEAKYRDGLKRSATTSFVNNEGDVVWVQEYLRYRVNGCSHGDAVTKVFQQIRGLGIQPVCR